MFNDHAYLHQNENSYLQLPEDSRILSETKTTISGQN